MVRDPEGEFYLVIYNPLKHLKFNNIHLFPALAPTDRMSRDRKLGILDGDGLEKRYCNYLKHNNIAR
jgi:hypothetical protein